MTKVNHTKSNTSFDLADAGTQQYFAMAQYGMYDPLSPSSSCRMPSLWVTQTIVLRSDAVTSRSTHARNRSIREKSIANRITTPLRPNCC